MSIRSARRIAGAVVAMGLLGAAQGDPLARVARGSWSVRDLGASSAPVAMCIADPRMLLQLGHRGATACTRSTLDAGTDSTTVRYTCPGAGYGRTELRVESEDRVRIHTQGLRNGAPFDVDYDARRIGTCG